MFGKALRGHGNISITWDRVRIGLEAAGYVTGLVPGQGAASAQFLVDVMSCDAAPKDMGDWWEGVRTDRIEDDAG